MALNTSMRLRPTPASSDGTHVFPIESLQLAIRNALDVPGPRTAVRPLHAMVPHATWAFWAYPHLGLGHSIVMVPAARVAAPHSLLAAQKTAQM
jgi:hypothetical protein